MLSVDGITKETFEKIRIGLIYETVLDNCLRFIKIRNQRKADLNVKMRMVLQDENRHEEKSWMDFWMKQLSSMDSVYSKEIHTWGNQLKMNNNHDNNQKDIYMPCVSPWSTIVIHYDGSVPLCCIDFDNTQCMGNISKSSIKDVWASDNDKIISFIYYLLLIILITILISVIAKVVDVRIK